MLRREFKQGEIYLIDFGLNSVGHEYQKKRPGVIVQANEQIPKTSLVTVLPFSSQVGKRTADDILVASDGDNLLDEDSVLRIHDIMSFDYQRFYYRIGVVNTQVMERIKVGLRQHFGI